jgi:hypothetical protein
LALLPQNLIRKTKINIMTKVSNEEQSNNANVRLCEGLIFTYSKLGHPFFLRENAKDCYLGICPRDWTPIELRKIADYIDANPNCKFFRDGSGS